MLIPLPTTEIKQTIPTLYKHLFFPSVCKLLDCPNCKIEEDEIEQAIFNEEQWDDEPLSDILKELGWNVGTNAAALKIVIWIKLNRTQTNYINVMVRLVNADTLYENIKFEIYHSIVE